MIPHSITREHVKITGLVILGVIALGMLFLAAFRFFAPDEDGSVSKTPEHAAVTHDTDSSLYVSEDGGTTWRGIPGARFSPFHVLFDTLGKQLLIGTQETGVWRALTDTYADVSQYKDENGTVPPEATVFDMALSDVSPARIYAALRYNEQGYLVMLTGSSFKELFFAPLEDTPVRKIAIDPFAADRIIIGAGSGFYQSSDAGETWEATYRFRSAITDILAHPHVPGQFFVTLQRGQLFRTSDYGKTWKEFTRSLSKFKGARNNQHLFIDSSSGIVYLTSDHGLLASWDDGAVWRAIPLIVPPGSLPALGFAIHPTQHNTLYISASSQLYKSEDGGQTWKGTQFMGKGVITAIAIDPADPETVVIGFTK
ncbi:MAG: hypothetical protein G01um101429_53 [Parcubacteria group bacterium Gr01-1014_29]|nr:MAG: hypothetical protein G01um101429_53 [Parcubacteria group bacterium Gr01-1014_29]